MSSDENELSKKELEVAVEALIEYKKKILDELEGCSDKAIQEKVDLYLKNLDLVLSGLLEKSTIISARGLKILHSAAEKYSILMEERHKDRKLPAFDREEALRISKYAASVMIKAQNILDSHSFLHLKDLEQ